MTGGCETVNSSPSYVPCTAYAPQVVSPEDSEPSTPSHVQPAIGMPLHCGG
jgi:hypothetical protein